MWSILFASLALATPEGLAAAVDDPKQTPCCFTNPQYSGVCSVAPVDETCESVLDYLNSPQSQGKSYCGNTSIRSGWSSQKCEPEPPPGS